MLRDSTMSNAGVLRGPSVDRTSWKRYAPPSVVALTTGLSMFIIAMVDPNQPGNYPPCPFLALTGFYCPGCGSTRALHALGHGDVAGAAGYNPLTGAAVPVLVWIWVRWLRRTYNGTPRNHPAPAILLWGFVAIVVAFGLIRNLPVGGPLAP